MIKTNATLYKNNSRSKELILKNQCSRQMDSNIFHLRFKRQNRN